MSYCRQNYWTCLSSQYNAHSSTKKIWSKQNIPRIKHFYLNFIVKSRKEKADKMCVWRNLYRLVLTVYEILKLQILTLKSFFVGIIQCTSFIPTHRQNFLKKINLFTINLSLQINTLNICLGPLPWKLNQDFKFNF